MSEQSGPNLWLALVAAASFPLAVGAALIGGGAWMASTDVQQERQRLEADQKSAISAALQGAEDVVARRVMDDTRAELDIGLEDVTASVEQLGALVAGLQSSLETQTTALAEKDAALTALAAQIEALEARGVAAVQQTGNASSSSYNAALYQGLAEVGVDWKTTQGQATFAVVERTAPQVQEASSVATEDNSATVTQVALAGDAIAGEKSSKKCAACHTFNEGGGNRVGPNLWGIADQPPAQVSGFAYSSAMKEFDGVWDTANLLGYLENPRKFMPGTKMGFAGLRKEDERANVVAYLLTLQ